MKFYALMCAAMFATPLAAQSFDVSLGGKTLGTLSYSQNGGAKTLKSTLNNTPLGVFNGTFHGSSKKGVFTGDSKSSRKQRRVEVSIAKNRAVSTKVTPQAELTELSDPALVVGQVTDPVQAIGSLINAGGCPDKLNLYDGRRVVHLEPTGDTVTGSARTCSMSYKVVQGPGHLSPLKISSAKMKLTYDGSSLQKIEISSGLFKLRLDRQD
ncbi:hypothetical protein [Sulfitobacter donghicola]|uniref:DUF3108 domain-containing protein n=1 Tax=Sulfitobacter donghicola DSW-25 = KCTC 12864 = JCM 14565 TaxID=1300350 RepID=A0A073IU06_9RHOB|nr:hypothetical protein [Sulfitobacter donghicola]KEJ88887.1 hypothetical protein DSW25_13985 [Sulfitobacter donghicola DSW-25 = KCTC 12864 = JCM 14565]KIN68542.1 hypothetical protein Z948_2273 [Sulfitobacter donghicola DSW-25 = KCTC 12864 = JCM 14565]